jgi:methionine-gamma-lyase
MTSHIEKLGFHSKTIHAGQSCEANLGSVSTPIFQTSTFAFRDARHGADLFAKEADGYIYTRMGNPTTAALEENVAVLENGCGALATSSGMAAITTIYLTFLGQGLHMVSTDCLYGPSRVVMERDFSRFGVEYAYINTSDLDEVQQAFQSNTRLLFIETPANPTIALTDIAACADIAHEHGALLTVDNTFMSPYLQRPLDLGADIVVHSMTKFINGHTDVVAGMIVCKDHSVLEKIRSVLHYHGGTIDPHQAWLVQRGLKTLPLRMGRCQENAMKLAGFLEAHPKVNWVKYPGLASHPQFQLANTQMDGPGALISFGVQGGLEAGRTVMNSVHLATLAVSLGGIETLIQHPASMTHAAMSKEEREKAGITDELVRLSVGCENYEDLQGDLEQALDKI